MTDVPPTTAAEPAMIAVPLVPMLDGVPFQTAIIAPLRAFWRWIVGAMVGCVAIVLFQQATATPLYSASAVVAASSPASSSKLGNLGSLASIAGVDLGTAKTVTSFDQFLFILYSPELAEYQIRNRRILPLVFARDWDGERHVWKRPVGLIAAVKSTILPIFHLPSWSPPDAQSLATRYGRSLDERKLPDSGLVRLVYTDVDPKRAEVILSFLVADANERLRREAFQTARAQAQYLRDRIAQTEVREYRNTLVELLAQQEQTLLLSNGAVPYAAKLIEGINASNVPTSQRPFIYALIAAVSGLSVASFIAILAYNRRAFQVARDDLAVRGGAPMRP